MHGCQEPVTHVVWTGNDSATVLLTGARREACEQHLDHEITTCIASSEHVVFVVHKVAETEADRWAREFMSRQ